jgi:hypothetical protein
MKDIVIQTAKFIELSTIIPQSWKDWFYCDISENAPFSWGDNNRTLIDADRFLDHCLDVLDYWGDDENRNVSEYKESFIDTLKYLAIQCIYIDMES